MYLTICPLSSPKIWTRNIQHQWQAFSATMPPQLKIRLKNVEGGVLTLRLLSHSTFYNHALKDSELRLYIPIAFAHFHSPLWSDSLVGRILVFGSTVPVSLTSSSKILSFAISSPVLMLTKTGPPREISSLWVYGRHPERYLFSGYTGGTQRDMFSVGMRTQVVNLLLLRLRKCSSKRFRRQISGNPWFWSEYGRTHA